MTFDLPLPPSTNMMFINSSNKTGKGRFPSPAYKAWKKEAAKVLERYSVDTIPQPYGVHIRVNINHQGDIANREKATCDALVAAKIITGDQWINRLIIERDRTVRECSVEVWSMAE